VTIATFYNRSKAQIFKLKTAISTRRSSSRCGTTHTGRVIRFIIITTELTIRMSRCCERRKEDGWTVQVNAAEKPKSKRS